MNQKIDRYIFFRLLTITVFVLGVLIFIFVVIDFSENSDDFTDRGATLSDIFGIYYLNYIPEMIRLVVPVAVFIACLYLTGQMADRLEIVALKAAGVSLYRLIIPYLTFGLLVAAVISYMDGYVIPNSNEKRIEFEKQYLDKKSEKVDNREIYRQESTDTIYKVNYFNVSDSLAYRVEVLNFAGDSISYMEKISRMKWINDQQVWRMYNVTRRDFNKLGFREVDIDSVDRILNIYPRDLARTTSDIYQLTYPEAFNYIESIERSGATGISLPQIQLFGRITYPLSIIVVTIVGFSIASVRRKGGKGFYIAAGLAISFLYLAMMKIIEPFGKEGEIEPLVAALIPHLFFLLVGLVLLVTARK